MGVLLVRKHMTSSNSREWLDVLTPTTKLDTRIMHLIWKTAFCNNECNAGVILRKLHYAMNVIGFGNN